MLYTPQIREAVDKIRVPKDFVVDVVEYNMYPAFIALRFYESQWVAFTEPERLVCARYLSAIKNIIESFGVPVTLEPVSDVMQNVQPAI